ncbi:MAG: type II secretion system F family protein [Anaerolineae bacterium]|jgi:tight adherence protein C
MDFLESVRNIPVLSSPPVFGILVGLATALIWLAVAPTRALQSVDERLQEHVGRRDAVQEMEMRQPFVKRVLVPVVRGALGWLGRRMPMATVENTQRQLVRAGEPLGLSALDFLGLCLLLPAILGGGYFLLTRGRMPLLVGVRNSLLLAVAGLAIPRLWLWSRVRQRQREIDRALPDALDMLSIGVEAGLAFESALLRVAEQWDNALTEEFRRAVREMRLGWARPEALRRMVERTGVDSLGTFVAVLVQSTQLGVSISEVLHSQAAQMRLVRRQRAEEQARQAGIKMVFPLVFLVFPAMFVVLLGPAAPDLIEFFLDLAGGTVN